MAVYFDGNGNIQTGTPPTGISYSGSGAIQSSVSRNAQAGLKVNPEFDTSYIDPSQAFQGDQGASKLLGQLNRAQWNDWKARFAPYITRLADEATDPNAAQDAARQASDSVGLAFDTATTINNQSRERYGVSLSPQQQQSQDRISKVGRSAAEVSAGNEARISAQDRQQSILAGGMGLSNIPDRVMNS